MYAVIKTGGKQYRVSEGDTLKVEKLGLDQGQTLEVDRTAPGPLRWQARPRSAKTESGYQLASAFCAGGPLRG